MHKDKPSKVTNKNAVADEDKKMFQEFVGDVQALIQTSQRLPSPTDHNCPNLISRRLAAVSKNKTVNNHLAGEEHIPPVEPLEILSFKREGIQNGIFRKLRQGKYTAEASIDLHKMTVSQARAHVFNFANDCLNHNIRCGLITHGKGEHRATPALLKSCVNYWLRELDSILAFHSAPRHSGGVGATLILFRKSPRKKKPA